MLVISESEFDFLHLAHLQIAMIYGLPKVLKGLVPLKGRPIKSRVDSLSHNCRICIDRVLAHFVQSLPSFVQDTTDLIKCMEGNTVGPESQLCSINVESLYTANPLKQGLHTIQLFLQMRAA